MEHPYASLSCSTCSALPGTCLSCHQPADFKEFVAVSSAPTPYLSLGPTISLMPKPMMSASRALASPDLIRVIRHVSHSLPFSPRSTAQQSSCMRQSSPNLIQSLPSLRRAFCQARTRRAPEASLTPTPKKRAGFFRWTWRLTKLGAVGGVAYLSYTIWSGRNPVDQLPPDPSKKTLVVLGESRSTLCCLKEQSPEFST